MEQALKNHKVSLFQKGERELISIKKRKKQTDNFKIEYVNTIDKVLQKVSHEVRKPICTLLGLIQLLDNSKHNAKKFDETLNLIAYIKSNVQDLDIFTRELTEFLHQSKKDKFKM